MSEITFRPLTAQDVEVRVAQCNPNGCSLLLYKDARCDMRILDESVGCERWQCRYDVVNSNLFCSVGILCDEWVWKQDVGTPSNMEGEKGEASDAFKRACFKWGIGRELYTAPLIWLKPGEHFKPATNKGGKPACFDHFSVERMTVIDGRITDLAIRNDALNKTVWQMTKTEDGLRYELLSRLAKLQTAADKLGMGDTFVDDLALASYGKLLDALSVDELKAIGVEVKAAIDGVEGGS